jgi:hypothetical protein
MHTFTRFALCLCLFAVTAGCTHSITRPITPGIAFCSLLPDGEDVTFETAQGSVTLDLDDLIDHPCSSGGLLIYKSGVRGFTDTYDSLAYTDIHSFTANATLHVVMRDGTEHSAVGHAWQIENDSGRVGDITMHVHLTDPKTEKVRVETRRFTARDIRTVDIGLMEATGGATGGVLLGLIGLITLAFALKDVHIM